jgi:DNA-binding transcriptional ArsR family regulator
MDNVSPRSAGVTVSHMVDAVRAVAALNEAQRTRLYRAVREAGAPMTREQAARQVGISRKLAAFHLDRLVDAGLLEASYDRPADAAARIGRAPKQYRASDVEVEISVPERHYDVVGEILIDALAVTSSAPTLEPPAGSGAWAPSALPRCSSSCLPASASSRPWPPVGSFSETARSIGSPSARPRSCAG